MCADVYASVSVYVSNILCIYMVYKLVTVYRYIMINDVSSHLSIDTYLNLHPSSPGLASDHLSQRLVLIAAHRRNVTWARNEAGTGR